MRIVSRQAAAVIACFATLPFCSAHAHPVSQGSMEVVIGGEAVKVRAVVSHEEVLVASTAAGSNQLPPLERLHRHGQYLLDHLRMSVDGRALAGRVVVTPNEITNRPVYELEYGPIGATRRLVRLEQNVLREIEFAPGNNWEASYVVHIGLAEEAKRRAFLLTHSQALNFDCEMRSVQSAGGTSNQNATLLTGFVRHGIWHILAGYDHLLFVGALVLAVTTFWDLIKIITAFTAAHTLTITLAALDLLRLPGAIVEPIIAGSIVFVALQNLTTSVAGVGWSRLMVAFGFGLFHGLGFAGGLVEAIEGMSGTTIALAIFAFSVGIEIGHQIVALPVFAVVRLARTWSQRTSNPERTIQWFGRGASGAICVAGIFYLVAALR